jgi:hypothetical protein
MTREHVDELFRAADPRLVDDLAQAIARGCVAHGAKLPSGCLTGIVKSLLFTLDQRRRSADA